MDLSKFKCCKTKVFNNYICVKCLNVFHNSCFNRMKDTKKLENHKIYCSTTCEEEYSYTIRLEGEINRLKQSLACKDGIIEKMEAEKTLLTSEAAERLNEMESEIKKKDNFYKLQIKSHKDFEDSALEMEQKLLIELKTSTNTVIHLQKRLNMISNENKILEEKIKKLEKNTTEIERQLMEMIGINRDMVSTIEIMEHEKEVAMVEKKKTICELDYKQTNNDNGAYGKTGQSSNVVKKQNGISRNGFSEKKKNAYLEEDRGHMRKKLLLIGDETAKNLASYVNYFSNLNYTVEGVSMPEVELATLAKSIFQYSRNYGRNDTIICTFKTLNISNHKHLEIALRHLLPLSRTTNLLLLSKLSDPNDYIIEHLIQNNINRFQAVNKNISIEYFPNIINMRKFLKTRIANGLNRRNNGIVLKSIMIHHDSTIGDVLKESTKNTFFQETCLQEENVR